MLRTLSEDDWFERLRTASQEGGVVDLRPAVESSIPTNTEDTDPLSADRSIPASAIRRVLTLPESEVKTLDPNGLQILGARIVGRTDWNYVTFPRPLQFFDCQFSSKVYLVQAKIGTLTLRSCEVLAITLDGTRIDGNFHAHSLVAAEEVRAIGIHVTGQLTLNDANLKNLDGYALNLDGARIDDGLHAHNLRATGMIRAVGVHANQISLVGANLISRNGDALNIDGARINCGMFADNLTAAGTVRADGANITGLFSLVGANLTNRNGDALNIDGARIDGDMIADNLSAAGTIRAVDAEITGRLSFNRSVLVGQKIPPLILEHVRVGVIDLRPTNVVGTIDLTGVTIRMLILPEVNSSWEYPNAETFAKPALVVVGMDVADAGLK